MINKSHTVKKKKKRNNRILQKEKKSEKKRNEMNKKQARTHTDTYRNTLHFPYACVLMYGAYTCVYEMLHVNVELR